MRTLFVTVVVAVLAAACGAKKAPIVAPTDPRIQSEIERIESSEEEAEIRELAGELQDKKIEELAEESVAKSDTPAEAKARKLLEKSKKEEERARRKTEQIILRAQINKCAPGEVWVSERVTQRSVMFPRVYLRVFNPQAFPVDIYDSEVLVVRGLCPGGSMTISKVLRYWRDGEVFNFQYTADGVFEDGSLGTATSQFFSLSSYDAQSGRLQQNPFPWVIQLNKVYVQD